MLEYEKIVAHVLRNLPNHSGIPPHKVFMGGSTMIEPNHKVVDPLGIPGRIFPLRRERRLEAASSFPFRFHDGILIVVVLSVWGYRLLSGRESKTEKP